NTSYTVTPGNVNYYNVIFAGPSFPAISLNSGTMNVLGTLTLAGSYDVPNPGTLINGTINAYGDVTTSNYGMKGSATIAMVGSSSQTITGSSTSSFPNLTIN